MSAYQLKLLLTFAGCYLGSQIIIWVSYGIFLYSKGRL